MIINYNNSYKKILTIITDMIFEISTYVENIIHNKM